MITKQAGDDLIACARQRSIGSIGAVKDRVAECIASEFFDERCTLIAYEARRI